MNERKHIKVLLIEDNPGDVRLIWEILSEVRNSPFYLDVADTLLKGLSKIEESRPDAILLDLSLPDSNGIYTLNRVRDRAKDIPVVVITGLDDEMTAYRSLSEGAQDYLVKGRTDADLLKRAIIYAIERNRLVEAIGENEKKLMEKDIQRSNFIAMVFHELLIPASSIKGTISACSGEMTDEERKKYVEIIKNNTARLFAVMDDLINTSGMESGKFSVEKKKMNIVEIINRNIADISAIAAEKNMSIINESVNKKIGADVDFHRISQAITNLLLNAIKFSQEGDIIKAGVVKEKSRVLIYVGVPGEGINKAEKEKILNEFSGAGGAADDKYKRVGLGLAVVKSIVAAHGGDVKAELSGENKGLKFYIILPG